MKLLDNQYATMDQVRAVWAAVTDEPRITITQISDRTGMKRTKINSILHFLEAAGYIEHKRTMTGRRVLVPFGPGIVVYAVEIPTKKQVHVKG